ncbi:protein MFI [Mesoplodon densirostris]|uniref:protein MFI n=1 Tax=Mesoplodon densirostris TaxID=48708 RepID=UPI0028DD25FF|nr:protein MFI [Mesoplodon densirostris]
MKALPGAQVELRPAAIGRYYTGNLEAKSTNHETLGLIHTATKGLIRAIEDGGIDSVMEWEVDEVLNWTNTLIFDENDFHMH